jgi:hypothetical protein
MAIKPITWAGTDTDIKMSSTIWGNCPWDQLKSGEFVNGVWFEDNFTSFNKTPATTEGNWAANNGYSQFSSTGGFINPIALSAATASGVPTNGINLGSDDNDEGASLRTTAIPFALNRAVQNFWFECQIKKSTLTTANMDFFVGLMGNSALTATVPITAAGALADVNLCGFFCPESGTSGVNTVYKADGVTAVTVGTGEATLVADTFTKLGMKLTQSGDRVGAYILSFYQDGVRLASTKQMPASGNGTDFPNDVGLGLVCAHLNATGTTPPTTSLRWWRAAQLYAPLM